MKKENLYQPSVIERIKTLYPDSIILKNDPNYLQGIPDLLILHNDRWAMLECKRSYNEPHRPNQDYYVKRLNNMGFASFIYPENEDHVMMKLIKHFEKY